jgi:hypothetical protein
MAGAMLAWVMRGRDTLFPPIATAWLNVASASALALILYAILFTRTEGFPGLERPAFRSTHILRS